MKWVDLQGKKDAYKQMMIDQLHALESVTVTEEDGRSGLNTIQYNEKKRDFYEFDTDDDEQTEDDVENEQKALIA